ncbi:MAG TPA: SMC-Scp complex subunit ScpB [Burkholderiales bacterium]|jgi:segregation and condensation protein B
MAKQSSELKNIIEAALLVAGQPLTVDRMAAMFPENTRPTREEIRAVLKLLEEEYRGRGFELKQVDRAYRLQTRDKYSSWLSKLVEERPSRHSRAALETLAIIAYRQPVTRGDIEDIRGVAVSTDIIRALLDRDWVREVGRREVPGRPALYGTTRGFLEYFNLGKLDELPPLSELRDIGAIGAELDQRAVASGQMPLLDQPVAATPVEPDANGEDAPRRAASNDATEGETVSALTHSAKPGD